MEINLTVWKNRKTKYYKCDEFIYDGKVNVIVFQKECWLNGYDSSFVYIFFCYFIKKNMHCCSCNNFLFII